MENEILKQFVIKWKGEFIIKNGYTPINPKCTLITFDDGSEEIICYSCDILELIDGEKKRFNNEIMISAIKKMNEYKMFKNIKLRKYKLQKLIKLNENSSR